MRLVALNCRIRLKWSWVKSRSGGGCVVADDDPFALDAYDRVPGDDRVWFLGADAEVLEPGAAADAEAGDTEVGCGELAAEVVATAERVAGFGDDLAAQER